MSHRPSDLLYDDAVKLCKDWIDEINWAKAHGAIDNLLVFTKGRMAAIQETLEAIRALKEKG